VRLAQNDWHNIGSYRAMPLVGTAKKQLDWILLEKYVDIY
jgi:hypothetical protein